MDYTLLPNYPPPLPPRAVGHEQGHEHWLTPRQVQVLVDLAKLMGIVVLLLWTRWMANTLLAPAPLPRAPLPYEVVAERFRQVYVGMPDEDLFALLGPQRFEEFGEREMDEHDWLVWARPDRYPEPRYWAKWAHPADRNRWVAVFLCGGKVYSRLKRGE